MTYRKVALVNGIAAGAIGGSFGLVPGLVAGIVTWVVVLGLGCLHARLNAN